MEEKNIGRNIAKNDKTALENKAGKKVISTENYLLHKLTK
ncbi:hypothetical protein A1C_06865 [Rickettsia akari str. Hartford]|uniref:Uncharacterized protein n=1 Tax=Rickettsia akari (strain Hartford) TaxID=293614 RepID=A8GQB8_RICAH|nr:hypothetical protein [Rickettsia akari]ABV75593.1 hypothetical protein A1C_06865 [Rickettsia akari str. Hartford]